MSATAVADLSDFVLERGQPLAFCKLDKSIKAAILDTLDKAPDLPSSAKRIWGYLSPLAGKKHLYVYPHHETIAEELGISKKTVGRSLKRLAKTGWMKYEPGAGNRRNKMWLMLPVSLDES